MEDGIEQNRCTLFDNEKIDNKNSNYIYVCIPIEITSQLKDYMITLDEEKAMNILKGKKYRVEVFKKNHLGFFVPSYDCLYVNC